MTHLTRGLLTILRYDYMVPSYAYILDPSRIAVFEVCKATPLTTQPPWLVNKKVCYLNIIFGSNNGTILFIHFIFY